MECFAEAHAARTSSNRESGGGLSARGAVAGVALVLAVTIAVRAYQPTGWLGSDDAAYYSAAEHILTDTPITRAHHHYVRTAIILPVAASLAVFGHHTWVVALPTFLASVACVMLVIALGRTLFGWREGLLAGLIVAVLPYFRVLSTTAYPDTHVCLWSTASVLLCVLALRSHPNTERKVAKPYSLGEPFLTVAGGTVMYLFASGFALGLAISSKVFAATTAVALAVLILQRQGSQWRRALISTGLIMAGWFVFFVLEGMFYYFWAGDFLFALHSHEQSQTGVPAMAGENSPTVLGFAPLVRERVSLFLQTTSSGWGLLGLAFWPAVFLGHFDGRSRALAVWAGATYLLIAFFPVSLAAGYQPYPIFHGRHILPACVPFALCLAFTLCTCLTRLWSKVLETSNTISTPLQPKVPSIYWVACGGLVVLSSFYNPRELNGFVDRPTGRVGEGLRALAAENVWQGDKPIYMTPSTYWRYRIVFPDQLRARLHVSVADGAPDWWRHVVPGIVDHAKPLPSPRAAYIVGTRTQLEGGMENWDYGVSFPSTVLDWQKGTGLGWHEDLGVFAVSLPFSTVDGALTFVLGAAEPALAAQALPTSPYAHAHFLHGP